MRIKENYVLRQIADTWAVLPLGSATLSFNGMMTLNDTGCLLWKRLEEGCEFSELVRFLLDEYEVTEEQAYADVNEFIEKLKTVDCIEI